MANQGNEGDEILFYSLRQSLSAFYDSPYDSPIIPASMDSIGQMNAEILVEIVIRTLQVITNNKEDLPVKLPQNIAARHRICTFIAKSVKENGFIGDCGYNQLLYPVEKQTRNLLNWVVEKLPKLDEGQDEEDLGSNALLNRRIKTALAEWSHTPIPGSSDKSMQLEGMKGTAVWTVPFCASSGGPKERQRFFRTVPYMLAKLTTSDYVSKERDFLSPSEVFKRCRLHGSDQAVANEASSIGPSILEMHAMELSRDIQYNLSLESDSSSSSSSSSSSPKYSAGSSEAKHSKESLKSMLQTAVSSAIIGTGGGPLRGAGGVGGIASGEDAFALSSAHQAYLNGTLQDLLGNIRGDADSELTFVRGRESAMESRFAHAMQFSQESSGTVIVSDAMSKGGGSGSLSATVAALSIKEKDASKEALQEAESEARQMELQDLKRQVLACSATIESGLHTQITGTAKAKKLEVELEALNLTASALESEILMKKKTLDMLPSAVERIKELQYMSEGSAVRMEALGREWETLRGPLMESYSEKASERDRKKDKCRSLVDSMKRLKQEMTAMIDSLKDRQDRSKVLEEELSRLPRHLHRSTYTHRIMEISASIAKQEEGIDKITAAIIDIQKTINRSKSAVQRADAITEELIYSAASDKNDPVMVDNYRNLRNLRSRFEELLEAVDKLGQQEKQERVLATKIDQEMSRVSANNLDRIQVDLDLIVQENAVLIAQIKTVKGWKK